MHDRDMNSNNLPVLVTGGTGTLGRHVVSRLRDAGHSVRILSRHRTAAVDAVESATADLTIGDGVDAAVRGSEVIIHLAGTAKGDEAKARHLVSAASLAGTRHIVYISVVGADRVPIVSAIDRAMFGYIGEKLGAERVISDSGIPWTTLRATQFHDLTLKFLEGAAKMPVMPLPAGTSFQPIAPGEVATRLVELALGEPAGRVPDMGGPRVYPMTELARSYLRVAGKRRLVLPMRMPGRAAAAFRDGANLAPERAVGRRTWEEFLADKFNDAPELEVRSGIAT